MRSMRGACRSLRAFPSSYPGDCLSRRAAGRSSRELHNRGCLRPRGWGVLDPRLNPRSRFLPYADLGAAQATFTFLTDFNRHAARVGQLLTCCLIRRREHRVRHGRMRGLSPWSTDCPLKYRLAEEDSYENPTINSKIAFGRLFVLLAACHGKPRQARHRPVRTKSWASASTACSYLYRWKSARATNPIRGSKSPVRDCAARQEGRRHCKAGTILAQLDPTDEQVGSTRRRARGTRRGPNCPCLFG